MRKLLKQVSQQLQRKSIPQLPRRRYVAGQLSALLPMLKLCDVAAAFGDFFRSWEQVMTGSFCGPLKVDWCFIYTLNGETYDCTYDPEITLAYA